MTALPHAHDAERALIGAALIAPNITNHVAELITPDDFDAPANKLIWQAICEVSAIERCDVITVAGWLARNGHTGDNYTAGHLLELHNATPAISNAASYARAIAGARLRRDTIHAAAEITRLAREHPDAAEAADQARTIVAHLDMPSGIGAPDTDAATFLDSIDYVNVDWLIPGILERTDRMLLTGTEGSGKSVMLTQIAVQCAAGVHPWTNQRIQPRNTLIIDCENGARRVARRLDQLIEKVPSDFDPQRLRVICRPEGLNLTSRADRLWLLDRCRANATELLVIGPAYRLSAGVPVKGDIGGEDMVRTITNALDECRTRYGVTILMETHAGHGSSYERDLRPIGSSVWLRWPEFGVGLRRVDKHDQKRYTLEHWRGPRDERIWPDELRKYSGRWPWSAVMPTGTFDNTPRGHQEALAVTPDGDYLASIATQEPF